MKTSEKATILAKNLTNDILKAAVISDLSYDDILEVFGDNSASQIFSSAISVSITATGYEKAKLQVTETRFKSLKKRLKSVNVKMKFAERPDLQGRDWSVDFTNGEIRAVYIAQDIKDNGDLNALVRVVNSLEPIFFSNVHSNMRKNSKSQKKSVETVTVQKVEKPTVTTKMSKGSSESSKRQEQSSTPTVTVVTPATTSKTEVKSNKDETTITADKHESKPEENTSKDADTNKEDERSKPIVQAVSSAISEKPTSGHGISTVKIVNR